MSFSDRDYPAGISGGALLSIESRRRSRGTSRRPRAGGSKTGRENEDRTRPRVPFVVRCEPRASVTPFTAAGLSIYIGQPIRWKGVTANWDSVMVRCEEERDGTLSVRVIVSNPEWHEPLQVACVRSRPGDSDCKTPLGCNLDHTAVFDFGVIRSLH